MKKLAVFFGLLMIFAPALSFSAEDTKIPDYWTRLTPTQKHSRLDLDVQLFLQEDFYKVYQTQFPKKIMGLMWQGALKSETKDAEEYGVKILRVKKGSPADSAGIRPGSWLASVNDVESCQATVPKERKDLAALKLANEKFGAYMECFKTFAKKALEAEEIVLRVDQDGKVGAFRVKKVEMGQEVADYLKKNRPAWRKSWKEGTEELQTVWTELNTMDLKNLDAEKLDALFSKVTKANEKMFSGESDLRKFEELWWNK